MADPFKDNVVLYLPMEGSGDGDTTILCRTGRSITRSGDVHLSTDVVPPFGLTSAYFDGTADYLTPADTARFDFGTADFTIEAWIYPANTTGYKAIFAGANAELWFGLNGTALEIGNWYVSGVAGSGASAVAANVWHHVVFQRRNVTEWTIWVNGARRGSAGTSSSSFSYASAPRVGASSYATDYSYFNGYIKGLRVTVGVARYSGTFSPEYAPYPWDEPNAPFRLLPSRTGSHSGDLLRDLVVAHLPFTADINDHSPLRQAGTASGGFALSSAVARTGPKSAYFDGTDDLLTLPYHAKFNVETKPFTLEAWIRPASPTAAQGYSICSTGTGNATTSGIWWYYYAPGAGQAFTTMALAFCSGSNVYYAAFNLNGLLKFNEWAHVAVTRIGDKFYHFVNGHRIYINTQSGSINTVSTALRIGDWNLSHRFAGYLQDFRFTSGAPRYLTDFTPPQRTGYASGVLGPKRRVPIIVPASTTVGRRRPFARGPRDDDVVMQLPLLTGYGDVCKTPRVFTPVTVGGTPSIRAASKGPDGAMFVNDGYLYTDSTINTSPGTQPFTIEFWVRLPTGATFSDNQVSVLCVGTQNTGASALGWNVHCFVPSDSLQVRLEHVYVGGSTAGVCTLVPNGELRRDWWYHVALTRSGERVYGYLNGALKASASFSSSISLQNPNNLRTYVGCGALNVGSPYWHGTHHLSGIRLTYRGGRYTGGAFTPPPRVSEVSATPGGQERRVLPPTEADPPKAKRRRTAFSSAIDPYRDQVVLHLHCDRVRSSNTTFLDSSPRPKALTTGAGAPYSNSSAGNVKFGDGAWSFDGDDYIDSAASGGYAFGPRDFTVEFFITPFPDVGAWARVMENSAYDSATQGWHFSFVGTDSAGSRRLNFQLSNSGGGGSTLYSNAAIPTGWVGNYTHVAVCRFGNTISMFINGVKQTATIDATGKDFVATALRIGASLTATNFYRGFLDEVRFTKGVARYTGNFRVPQEPFYSPDLYLQTFNYVTNAAGKLPLVGDLYGGASRPLPRFATIAGALEALTGAIDSTVAPTVSNLQAFVYTANTIAGSMHPAAVGAVAEFTNKIVTSGTVGALSGPVVSALTAVLSAVGSVAARTSGTSAEFTGQVYDILLGIVSQITLSSPAVALALSELISSLALSLPESDIGGFPPIVISDHTLH